MTTVTAERKGAKRIEVRFDYDQQAVTKIRTIAGRSFHRTPYNHWTVPLDMTVCRALRRLYGRDLRVGPSLKSWAWQKVQEEEKLVDIVTTDHADLPELRRKLPTLWRALYFGPMRKHALEHGISEESLDQAQHLFSFMAGVPPWSHGSYQTADVRFLSDSPAPLNANHQGLGKTLEAIAEIFEAGREVGWHLIIAPSVAVDGTWEPELEQWLAEAPCSVGIFACAGSRKKRDDKLQAAMYSTASCNFVIVNPAMVTFRKDPFNLGRMAVRAREVDYVKACHCDRLKAAHWHYEPAYDDLMNIYWDTIINDEVHKGNIRNHRTITGHSMGQLRLNDGGKFVAMSGTPMKKKGADIWGVLNWLRPDVFTSYWRFAETYFEISKVFGGHQKVGALREEMEGELDRTLLPYVVRRTKAEVLPFLPDKMHIHVPVTMDAQQERQYRKMFSEGIAIDADESIPMTSILAEFTRLQQFANAYHRISAGGHHFTPDLDHSAKVDALFAKLDEAGILDGSSSEKVVIFSRYKAIIEAIGIKLNRKKVQYGVIKGGTENVRELKEAFQHGDLRVMLVVTSAGGVSLTLDAADTAHFLEPSWAPDEAEQAEDRLHRASRIHQVIIYTYVAIGTLDEYIIETAFEKDQSHKRILDVRRRMRERAC